MVVLYLTLMHVSVLYLLTITWRFIILTASVSDAVAFSIEAGGAVFNVITKPLLFAVVCGTAAVNESNRHFVA